MAAKYQALTYINLPGVGRKAPGDPITVEELEQANQGDEDIAKLKKDGALGSPTDDIHPDHKPVEIVTKTTSAINVVDGEEVGVKESNA